MSGSIVVVDHGWDDLMRAMHRAAQDEPHVKVGVVGDGAGQSHADSGLTNAELAAVHEFGTIDGHIPERSFLRSTIDENAEKYHDFAKALHLKVIEGKITTTDALGLFGARVVADVKRKLQAGIDPPLADSTVDRKGSSKPLIDTGALINSITWMLENA